MLTLSLPDINRPSKLKGKIWKIKSHVVLKKTKNSKTCNGSKNSSKGLVKHKER